ncbi:MBL fold metallo-hydrolase [Limnohabitans sp. 2KL-51]|uniref:MBL fold metallo-hydrolase n=1 Tax=Limnohabitans sp. 2KL-51 TaxID=1977911 RepID=UPI000D37AF8B|nr:MBL fold metallo-hydrolase [Limnohabitans sp. 2KL-51]PUE51223.1 MBL fold metallo-hydrolase [Limnohabitans sp. 2KL-51]
MASVLNFGAVRVHLGEKSGKYPDGNQLIVQGADMRVAFDTPEVANRIGPELDTVDLVILGHVHEDHMAGLHRLTHAPVQVHEADLAAAQSWDGLCQHYGYPAEVLEAMHAIVQKDFHYQPRPDATGYSDGALWDLGGGVRVRAHHLPGHTAGHCALVVESEGLAFIGDIDLSGFGPYYGDATSNLSDFRHTLKKVAELDARIWATSHHKSVITDRAQFLADLARFASKIDERSAQLLGYLQTPNSLHELVSRRLLYPQGYDVPFVPCAERNTIDMHLEELLAQGQIQSLEDGRFVAV